MSNQDATRRLVLDSALSHVPFDGWTDKSLAAAARDLDLSAENMRRAFPGGVAGLAAYFSAEFDRRMTDTLAGQDLDAMKVRVRIGLAVRARLELLAPHKEAVRRLAAYSAMPGRGFAAVRAALATVDAIWRAAGDSATDFNYYTKRGLLAPVYGATLLYWLSDETEGSEETWAFLDRRIAEILKIPAIQGRISRLAGRIPTPPGILNRVRKRLKSA
ncbi:MAG: COQ9 family protein [Rhodospirillaceae bacterium]|nr:COQ9 family protein [Rhodospirillaceae bacterium]MBT6293034.1 COQ9 family protein [Rhodospirillaceae bacterium]